MHVDVIVTGAAGFIGAALTHRLLDEGRTVHGVDSLNAYYDPALKSARLARLTARNGFSFDQIDLAGREATLDLFARVKAPLVVHLAAQAGVRWSIEKPEAYAEANLVGFQNVVDGCRAAMPAHLVYASSSSVYGANTKLPFAVGDPVDHPVSLYAATKKANELVAHTYSHLFGLPTTGLRFFTVYGPWGRPDMAYFSFTKAIAEGRPIKVFNHGRMKRDFTFVDDIVEGLVRVAALPPAAGASPSGAPAALYNIGNDSPVALLDFIGIVERLVGRPAVLDMHPMQPGDVEATWADIGPLEAATGFRPKTTLEQGLTRFVDWYRGHYGGFAHG